MAKKNSYREYLKNEFSELIDALELPDLNKRFMKSRWLDQLLWLEDRAERASKWSTRLRLTTIVGGVMIPALVSLNFSDSELIIYIGWVTFGLSQVVAIGAAVEEYFHFGEKKAQYRKTAESLKSEAWKFLQLSGSYQEYPNHMQAYSIFAFRVESYIQQDVQAFMQLAEEKAGQEQQQPENQGRSPSFLSGAVSDSGTSNISPSMSNIGWESEEEYLPNHEDEPLESNSSE